MPFVANSSEEEDWLAWFVRLNRPSMSEMWQDNPTYLIGNIVTIFMAFLSLKFSLRHGIGSRYTYLWFAALLHGVVTEMISYNFKEINSFWHSQTFMIFAGQRFPLYIVIFYPALVVHAYIAASRLKLPWWAEPFAVGLFDCLLDFPYDIIGIKFVWWTWHDTDVHIFDRHYWVPWSSYFFHMSFHSSLVMLLHGSRYLITGDTGKVKSHGFFKESLCVVITALFSMALAVATQIMPVMTLLHENYNIHSEVVLCVMFGVYVCIVWSADRSPKNFEEARSQTTTKKGKWYKHETVLAITLHFIMYPLIAMFGKPENVISRGLHEPLGPRDETVQYYGASGKLYTKQKYFDPMYYDEGVMDFHCVPGGAPNITEQPELIGKDWYVICGKKFENHAEYVLMVTAFSLLGLFVFYNALSRSATQSIANKNEKIKQN